MKVLGFIALMAALWIPPLIFCIYQLRKLDEARIDDF